MLGNINNNKTQGLSNPNSGSSNGSAGASGGGVQLGSAMQQISAMRGGTGQEGGKESSSNNSIKQIKGEIALLYIQLAEVQKSSVGPSEVRESPWTSGPRANNETGQKEQIMALIRIKEEKIKAIESFGEGGGSNKAAFNDLMKTYTQMEDMAKMQDFDPSYKGFNSNSITTNSYVFDKMTNLRSMAEIYKAQIANSQ